MLRIDSVELDDVLGLRFNVWTSIVLFLAAAIYFVISARRHPGREEQVRTREPVSADDVATDASTDDASDDAPSS